jgi:CBS domain-containing protein
VGKMLVNEIMTKEIVSIESDYTILEACKRYNRYKIGCLIVMDQGVMKGIITERDIISRVIILMKNPSETTVEEIMSKNIISVKENEDVENAIQIMGENNIKKLPVVSDDKVVGIITITDIMNIGSNYLKSLADEYKVEAH